MKWFRRKSTYSEDGPLGFAWDGEWFQISKDVKTNLWVVTDGDNQMITYGWTPEIAAEQAGQDLAIIRQKIEDELEEMFQ